MKRYTASIQLPPRGKAPERIRIWRAGSNPGDYGACNLTPAAAAAVMADFTARGNAGAIDVEHGTNRQANPDYDPATPPPGGGYYVLDVVDTADGPELWASVRWSDYAVSQIESGERCYVSPDWLMSQDTREPSRLNKLSLVQEPGTYGINMLASRASAERNTMDLETLKALLAAAQKMADSAENADLKAVGADLVKQLTDMASKLGLDLTAAPEAAPASEAAPVAAAAPAPAADPKAMPAAASKSITLADVQSVIREERAKSELLTAAVAGRQGMTPALASLLAGKSLAECRAFVGALPMVAAPTVKITLPALNATAAAAPGEPESTPAEDETIARLRSQLGVTAAVASAAKAEAAAGTLGVLSVARIQDLKAKARAANAANVAAAK